MNINKILDYNEGIIGTFRDIKSYMIEQVEKMGEEQLTEETHAIIESMKSDKVEEYELVYIQEAVMGGFKYNKVKIEEDQD